MGLLRLFLALSVVIHHLPQRSFAWLNAGVAVLVFFMISGFYMALIINERYSKMELWHWRFYLSRVYRIFPAYYAVLTFALIWFAIIKSPSVFSENYDLGFWRQLGLILPNLLILGQDMFQAILMTNAYDKHNMLSDSVFAFLGLDFFQNQFMIIGQAWSLAEELVFYALAPFFVLKRSRVLAILAISLGIRALLQVQSNSFPPIVWGYWFFPSTISFFCLGALGYFGYKKISCFSWGKTVGVMVWGLATILMIYSLLHGGILYEGTDYDSVKHWMFFISIAICIPFIFLASKDSYFDRLLGEFSYPLYLVHGFVIGILFSRFGLKPGSLAFEALVLLCSVGISALIYIGIDYPVDRHRRCIETARLFPLLRRAYLIVATILVIGFISSTRTQFLEPHPSLAQERPGLYGKAKSMPPILVEVVGKFNIVSFNNLYYAIPHGQGVDWNHDNVSELHGVLTGRSRDEIITRIPH